MNVGYRFLQPPPLRRPEEPEGVEQTSLEGLRRYMCPISNGDFRRCGNCQGLKTCKVGQRVEVLLAERKKRQDEAKWSKVLDEPERANIDEGKRSLLKKACESGNAWNYIIVTMGLSRDAAKEALLALIRKYPGVAAEYGGSRRIMQRPKVVTVSQVDPPQNAEQAAGIQEEKPVEETGRDESQPEKKMSGPQKGAATVAKRARELYLECLAADDPVAHYMQVRGVSEESAKKCWKRMTKRYAEAETTPKARNPAAEEDTDAVEEFRVAAEPEESTTDLAEAQPKGWSSDGEISVFDFLRQYDANPEQRESDDAGAAPDPESGPEQAAAEITETVPLALEAIRETLKSGNTGEKLQAAGMLLDCFLKIHAAKN